MSRWRSALFVLAAFAGLIPLMAAPAPRGKKPAVDVVYVIDTTASMGGLLDGMRRAHWAICNQMLSGKPTPELRIGVVAYRDKGDDYVTKIADLTDDLDDAYLALAELVAAGGGDTPEHVNQALADAVHKLSWSKDEQAVRIVALIGDAAPHLNYADDVKYPDTCRAAAERGIVVNAIVCGKDADCRTHFGEIARLGGGTCAAVAQNGGGRVVPTPLDKRLSEINAALASAAFVHGSGYARVRDQKKVTLARELPPEAAADRAGCLSKLGLVARFDLIDADRAGLLRLSDVVGKDLPPPLRGLSDKARQTSLDAAARERSALLREAHELNEKRAAYLQRNRGAQADGVEECLVEMLRKQTARRVRY